MHYKTIVIGDNVEEQLKHFDQEVWSDKDCNENGKWDWYTIEEGRWEGILLKNGLCSKVTLIQDVVIDELECAILLYNGEWMECPFFRKDDGSFTLKMRNILKNLPNNTKITLVDIHS